MNNYKTDAIIIKRTNIGEADRLLTLLTPYYGKIRVIAKGARKITSRRAPSLELFNHVSLLLHRGKTLDIVVEIILLDSFGHIKQELKDIAVAYQLCELTHLLTRDQQELEEVYLLLNAALIRIDRGAGLNLNEFKQKLLVVLGFGDNSMFAYQEIDGFIEDIAQKRLQTRNIYGY